MNEYGQSTGSNIWSNLFRDQGCNDNAKYLGNIFLENCHCVRRLVDLFDIYEDFMQNLSSTEMRVKIVVRTINSLDRLHYKSGAVNTLARVKYELASQQLLKEKFAAM